MPLRDALGPGQRERIVRGERTDPRVIIGQVGALIAVVLLAFVVVRTYIYYWDWITKNEAHDWLSPIGIILVFGCGVAAYVLFIEVFDPNYPNPRQATGSTKPLWPWSRERQPPEGDKVSINLRWKDLLDALNLEMVEEEDEDDDELD